MSHIPLIYILLYWLVGEITMLAFLVYVVRKVRLWTAACFLLAFWIVWPLLWLFLIFYWLQDAGNPVIYDKDKPKGTH